MLLTEFGVNWPFGSEEVKNRFSRWPWQPSWTSHQNGFSYFDLLVTLMLPIKFQDDFQDGGNGSHLGFPIGTILAIFYLQGILMLPTVSCHLAFQFRRREK